MRLRRAGRGASPDNWLLLDYDGTLVPIAKSPELAAPDEEVLELLDALARRRGVRVAIVSGRARPSLEMWLGHLPIGMWAEHGFWHRAHPDAPWEAASSVRPNWLHGIATILEHFTATTPGSHIERKTAAIAWHYRLVDRELVEQRTRSLRARLTDELQNGPFEILNGKKVIEVRLRGISKALVAERLVAECATSGLIVAIGDDRTDEELFRALPGESVTVAVGSRSSSAKYRVADFRAVRRILRSLLDDPSAIWSQHESFTDARIFSAGPDIS